MNERTIEVGGVLKLGGRNYVVKQNLPIGPATAKACPWIREQWAVEGVRGACAMLVVFTNNTYRLCFLSGARRVETGAL